MRYIDLRSDTVTTPTPAMRKAMHDAEVGDDVYGDDPTVNRLETLAAEKIGKEAALFVPTGAMGNQIAIMSQTRPGDEIIATRSSHVFTYEAGGPARLSGVTVSTTETAPLTPADLQRLVRPLGNIHYPRTTLVCLENALSTGEVMPLEAMQAVRAAAQAHNLKVHLDGARLFNAALALGVEARELAAEADSVMFCLSKGLASPVGSMLCGSAEMIAEARRCRKLLGGGMRQVGVLAACGLISLNQMVARLAEDHENAQLLGRLLAEIPGITVDGERLKINMLFWRPESGRFDSGRFVAFMLEGGIKVNGAAQGWYRFITHKDVSREDVAAAARRVGEFVAGL